MKIYDPSEDRDTRVFMLTNKEMKELLSAAYSPANAGYCSIENILKYLEHKDVERAKMECEVGMTVVAKLYKNIGECFRESQLSAQEKWSKRLAEDLQLIDFWKENSKELT